MAKFEIELPFGTLEADSYTELKHLVYREREFWEKIEISKIELFLDRKNFWNRYRPIIRQFREIVHFWIKHEENIDRIDGRSIDDSFGNFRQSIEDEIFAAPWSRSNFAIALMNDYEADRLENVAALLTGFVHNREERFPEVLSQQASEGGFLGHAKGYFSAVSTFEDISDASNFNSEINDQLELVRQSFKSLSLSIDEIEEKKRQISDDLENAERNAVLRWKKMHKVAVRYVRRHNSSNRSEERRRTDEFSELLEAFNAHMRLARPVKLWDDLQDEHGKNAKVAWNAFLIGSILFGLASISIVYFFGDGIAQAFIPIACTDGTQDVCERMSAKGPLIISAILAGSTVWLWFLRLQMKVHLSERHLFLDARERKAFAETYLSLLKGGEVSNEHEAVVLQSLFRPTQDGIIKDDGGVDVGVAGLLSKMLAK